MKIANACGFWGDDIDAPRRTLELCPDLDYLTLDYLAEVSLSIMAIQKEKDSALGYARDFLDVLKSLVPYFKKGGKCRIITNGGGLNPEGLAKECKKILGSLPLKIGVITGDNVLDLIDKQTGELFSKKSVTANAYIGARPIAIALALGADIVIGGRIADPSLTVGPCLYHYNWAHDAYDQLAGATVAGHLIECGVQVTGGILTDWENVADIEHIGYPIAEVFEDGSCVITKPEKTGGIVSEKTVKEQLLYELGNPGKYKSPDATVSFLKIEVEEKGKDRVYVKGAAGSAPPFTLKVSSTYRAGFKAEGYLAFTNKKNAERAAKIIFSKVPLQCTSIEVFGDSPALLRVAARDEHREALEMFARQIAPLVTSGPQGTTGYISGRPEIRPVFGFRAGLIDFDKLRINVEVIS